MNAPTLYNRTRLSPSIPAKLRRERRWLEIPLYHLLSQSDLAREGMEHSGSYRFADHIYRGVPSGTGVPGTALDWALLRLPAVRSFRNRYLAAREALVDFLVNRTDRSKPVQVLSAPCGLPRELAEAARLAEEQSPGCLENVQFRGLDLNPVVLREAKAFTEEHGLTNFSVHWGDALDRSSYPVEADFITCTGLAEFLDDETLGTLYGVFHQVLKPGGHLFTSGMRRLPLSDYLLELAELHTHYRMPVELARLGREAGFASVRVRMDGLGIQSLMVARK